MISSPHPYAALRCFTMPLQPVPRRSVSSVFSACRRWHSQAPRSTSSWQFCATPRAPLRSRPLRSPRIPLNLSRASFSTSSSLQHGDLQPPKPGEERTVTIVDKEGEGHKFEVADGDNLLDIAQANDLEMEGKSTHNWHCILSTNRNNRRMRRLLRLLDMSRYSD